MATTFGGTTYLNGVKTTHPSGIKKFIKALVPLNETGDTSVYTAEGKHARCHASKCVISLLLGSSVPITIIILKTDPKCSCWIMMVMEKEERNKKEKIVTLSMILRMQCMV